MNLRSAYEFGTTKLSKAGITEANLDAWLLLEYITGVSRAVYYMDQEKLLTEEQETNYLELISKRSERIPLQHLTGEQEFMGFSFHVNEHVLIPRQDTELLVETVLSFAREGDSILDMCTGSGCILLSLMKLGENLAGTGVDISREALKVAEENGARLEANATWICSDLFAKVEGKYDIIVSNPPYIPTAVIEELEEEVKLHDPWGALDGKEDGLYFYRRIVKECKAFLKDGGRLFFEIGHDQAEPVTRLMEEAGFSAIVVKKDLAGLDRVVFGVYNISEDRNR